MQAPRVSQLILISASFVICGCSRSTPHTVLSATPSPARTTETRATPTANADSIAAERRAAEERRARESAARTAAALREAMVSRIHFDFDKSDLRPEDLANLSQKAKILEANPGVRMRIAGNCDERGSDEYNLVLGNQRGVAAKQYLTELGVNPTRLEVTSNGEVQPFDPGHTEEAWARNRRDEFVIVAGDPSTPPR